jgi:glucose/arabinose dehydrogenase
VIGAPTLRWFAARSPNCPRHTPPDRRQILPGVIPKPGSAAPKVPPGFQVELFVSNLRDPRMVRVAPNGDIFIAESEPGRIRVLRTSDREAQPSNNEVFASGLDQPFGIAFYPPGSDPLWIYVANTGSVVRYPYRNGDLPPVGRGGVDDVGVSFASSIQGRKPLLKADVTP